MEVCRNATPSRCCTECRSKYYKDRYAKRRADPEYTAEKHKGVKAVTAVAERRNELRKIIYEHYENNPCLICGEARIACLQLDHLRDKIRNVSKMVSRAVSKEVLLEEIAKCRVLCANCHAVHTASQLGWYAWRDKDLPLSHSG